MTKSVVEYLSESVRPKYDLPLALKGSLLWLSDVELPFHHSTFINQSIALAKQYGVGQVVFGGDLLQLEAFSPFPNANTDAETEIRQIDQYLPELIEPFEKCYWLMGNHDARAMKVMERKLKADQVLRLFVSDDNHQLFREKVTVSDYYWCYAGYDWQLEHAANNRMMPASTAKALAEKFRRNIVMGHSHKIGMLQDVSGKLVAIESGCCVDINRLAYPNLRHSTHTQMVNGAVLMIDTGRMYSPLLLSPLWTDWEFETWKAKNLRKHF